MVSGIQGHEPPAAEAEGYKDKRSSEALARNVEELMELTATGQPPTGDLARWVESLAKPLRNSLAKIGLLDARSVAAAQSLSDHLADFRQYLTGKGNTKKHVDHRTGMVKRTIEACGWKSWSDISASGL